MRYENFLDQQRPTQRICKGQSDQNATRLVIDIGNTSNLITIYHRGHLNTRRLIIHKRSYEMRIGHRLVERNSSSADLDSRENWFHPGPLTSENWDGVGELADFFLAFLDGLGD